MVAASPPRAAARPGTFWRRRVRNSPAPRTVAPGGRSNGASAIMAPPRGGLCGPRPSPFWRYAMNLRWTLAAAALLAAGAAVAQDTNTDKGKLSYAIGYQIGSDFVERKMDVDVNTVIRALQDGYAK